MLSSDTTFSTEIFPFRHCPDENGNVSTKKKKKANEDGGDELDNVKTDGGLLENSRGKRLAISMVVEAWLSEKEEV
ncbi:hypothetical protein Tco_1560587 [Tanacetum coccineum]